MVGWFMLLVSAALMFTDHRFMLACHTHSPALLFLLSTFTYPFVHYDWDHFGHNFLVGFPALLMIEKEHGFRRTAMCAWLMSLLGALLESFDNVHLYGSSSVTIGAVVLAYLILMKTVPRFRWVGLALALEEISWQLVQLVEDTQATVAHGAHLGGITVAVLAFAWWAWKDRNKKHD